MVTGTFFVRLLKILAVFFLAILMSSYSLANIRAPKMLQYPPSSTLYKAAASATVLTEEMNVDCDRISCEVTVKYFIEVENEFSATVDFMVPGEVDVLVKVGSGFLPVVIKSLLDESDLREMDTATIAFFGRRKPLFRATFLLSLAAGRHEILIKYQQPLSQREVGYGYFSDGYFIGTFQYELWPIKEWSLANNFTLDLSVTLGKNSISWWENLVDDIGIVCDISTFTQCGDVKSPMSEICHTTIPLVSSDELDPLVIKSKMQPPLPDRLSCKIGPK